MPVAAAPKYLGSDFKEASPGLRFGIYLPIWTSLADLEKEVEKRAAAGSTEGKQVSALRKQGMDFAIARLSDEAFCRAEGLKRLPKLFGKNDFAARTAWKTIAQLNSSDRALTAALLARQSALACATGSQTVFSVDAVAVAPFTTGLGNEHPLENGFAFLNPYGLPYLPGSGVKGVLRQAARELASGAWGNTHGWSAEKTIELKVRRPVMLSVIDVLFGLESRDGEKEHVRGALSFWDVIPQIAGDSLMVEIMTPHQSHYYQQKQDKKAGDSITPHDSGQPNPIAFLTVPPGSRFVFHVVCDRAHLGRLAPALLEQDGDGKPRWQGLLRAAFAHAFEWLGFGAKTAIGYGAMRRNEAGATTSSADAPHPSAAESSKDPSEKGGASPSPIQVKANLNFDKSSQQVRLSFFGTMRVRPFFLKKDEIEKRFRDPRRFDQLIKNSNLQNATVVVSGDRPDAEIIEII